MLSSDYDWVFRDQNPKLCSDILSRFPTLLKKIFYENDREFYLNFLQHCTLDNSLRIFEYYTRLGILDVEMIKISIGRINSFLTNLEEVLAS